MSQLLVENESLTENLKAEEERRKSILSDKNLVSAGASLTMFLSAAQQSHSYEKQGEVSRISSC